MAELTKPWVVLYGSRPVLYAQTVSFQASSNDKAVNTIVLGLAGHSDGPEMVKVDVESAVPAAGLEVDWAALSLSHTTIDLAFKGPSRTYQVRGRVLTADLKSSAESPTTMSMSFEGRLIAIA